MFIKQAIFVRSMRRAQDLPQSGLPEIAVCGRSNSGKSSLVNCLAGRHALARTSAAPGKTRLINFYRFTGDPEFLLADLPGYGYARVSRDEKDAWARMVEGYFAATRGLRALLVLMDIRHTPGEHDRQLLYWAQVRCVPFVIVATKADKVAKTKRPQYLRGMLSALGIEAGVRAVAFSARDRTGRDELLGIIEETIREGHV